MVITPYMSVFVVPQAIISLIPILKRPPVSRVLDEHVCVSYRATQLTVVDHGNVFFLCRTHQGISPVKLEALTTMQIQQFI
jgi:hypothetical protein